MTRPDYLKMLAALPHSNPDLDSGGPTTTVTVFRSALQACNDILISSPEYGDRETPLPTSDSNFQWSSVERWSSAVGS
jgi:hypothetical protein